MAFNITATAQALQTHLKDSRLFSDVEIGTPNSPPGEGPVARIAFTSMFVAETTLTTAIEVHVLEVAVYLGSYVYGEQSRELQSSILVSNVMDYLYEDFTLGGAVRNVDVGGQYGTGLEVEFEDEEIVEQSARVARISVPVIVDSATSLVA